MNKEENMVYRAAFQLEPLDDRDLLLSRMITLINFSLEDCFKKMQEDNVIPTSCTIKNVKNQADVYTVEFRFIKNETK